MCREKGSSYLPPITQFDCATNMRSLHSEACFHNPPWGCHLCALSNPYGYCRRGVLALARFSHIHLPASLPSERFCFPPLQRIASQPYYEGSDSCSAHPPSRSPRLSRHPFLPFRLQPRWAAWASLPPRQRAQRVSDFTMNEQARRSSPPNRVRLPTDRPFASDCSPPRFSATQLPSATEFVASSDMDSHHADMAPSRAHSFRASRRKLADTGLRRYDAKGIKDSLPINGADRESCRMLSICSPISS